MNAKTRRYTRSTCLPTIRLIPTGDRGSMTTKASKGPPNRPPVTPGLVERSTSDRPLLKPPELEGDVPDVPDGDVPDGAVPDGAVRFVGGVEVPGV